MALVGKKAPTFSSEALIDGQSKTLQISDYRGKYVAFFFYPKDDTSVCGSEVHAIHKRLEEFKSRGAEVVAASVDDMASHMSWASRSISEGGISGLSFPIVSDANRQISASYDVLAGEWAYNNSGEVTSENDLITY